MKTTNHPVLPDAERPRRPDGTCFYCHEPVGGQHAEGCVLRRQTVVVDIAFQAMFTMPENFTMDDIEKFFRKGRSPIINELLHIKKNGGRIETLAFNAVREATEDDENYYGGVA